MKSVAYATDDSASDDSTASPVTRDNRSCWARYDGIGLPTRKRLRFGRAVSSATGSGKYNRTPGLSRMRIARRYLVSGRVQGVGFRFYYVALPMRDWLL